MPEYIEREALIEKISALETAGVFSNHFKNIVLKIISEQPAADVVEVKRRDPDDENCVKKWLEAPSDT